MRAWLCLTPVLLLHSVAAQADSTSARTVFRCKQADVTIFSDVPCDASAEIYNVNAPAAILQSVPIARVEPAVPAKAQKVPVRTRADAHTRSKAAERCEHIRQSLQEIRSKMRSGYTSEEGRRLRARQSKLEDQRRSAQCG